MAEAPAAAGTGAASSAAAKGRALLLQGLRSGEVDGIIDRAEASEEATAATAKAKELAARAVSAAVSKAVASPVAAGPTAPVLSADVGPEGPDVRTGSDAKPAEEALSDEDRLLASRPTIPVKAGGRHADASAADVSDNNTRRRNSFQPPKRFQMKKLDPYTIGEVDEDPEGPVDYVTRHKSLPANVVDFGRKRLGRQLGAPGVAGLEALVMDGRPRQPMDASGWRLPTRLQALLELPEELEPPSARPLVEGLFIVAADKLGAPCVNFRWLPQDGAGYESLEDVVVRSGFCPDPVEFAGSEPFVFSLLETALDTQGSPGGTLFGCVCGERRASWSPIGCDTPAVEEACRVFCLVSRLPLFELHFEVLEIIRGNLSAAGELLARINGTGLCESLVSEGLELGDFPHLAEGSRLRLRPPRPLLFDWRSLSTGHDVSPWSPVSRTLARWQVAWALGTMMTHWDNLVGDTLLRLLACVLLEQKILLLGDVPRSSATALALRGLLWPFRWLHLFLSAPPPPELLDMPLLDGTFPLVICFRELPQQWGFRTPYELPPEAVAGILRHDYVHVSQRFETAGGLKGRALKLPEGRHALVLKQIAYAKQKLRKGEVDVQAAAELVQEAIEAEVWRLAKLVKEYAAVQVEAVRKVRLPVAPADAKASVKGLQERCSERAMQPEVFLAWLTSAKPASCTEEALPFYQTFFGTQLCHDLLCEEVLAQVRSESPSDPQG